MPAGASAGGPPAVAPVLVTSSNFAAQIAAPSLNQSSVRITSSSNAITALSASRALGRPAAAYVSTPCERVEIVACVTNVNEAVVAWCQVINPGRTLEDCIQESTAVESTGTGQSRGSRPRRASPCKPPPASRRRTGGNAPSGTNNPATVPATLPTRWYRLFKP